MRIFLCLLVLSTIKLVPTPAFISLFDLFPLVHVLIPSWSIISQIFSNLFISPLLFLSINPIQIKEPYLPILFLNVPLVVKVETLLLSVRIISNWEKLPDPSDINSAEYIVW